LPATLLVTAITAASVGAFTGVLVSIGMVLHEFPEGVFTYVLLRKGGFQEHLALWAAVFAAVLTTPLRTLISFPIISRIDEAALAAPARSICGCIDLCRCESSPPHRRARATPL
jgi:zinc transporter ZupT